MSNINEIARLANVSRSTVSRVVSGNGYVKKETREKVQKIIEELDYTPNQNAIFLKNGRTKTLGIVTPEFSDIFSGFLSSFSTIAQKYGYQIHLILTGFDGSKELEAFQKLKQKQIDGIFLLYAANEWGILEKFSKYGPIVTWQRMNSKVIDTVFMDHYPGYLLGLEHLYRKGYRKIMPIFGLESGLNSQARLQAWTDFSEKMALKPVSQQKIMNQVTNEDGKKLAHWWLEQTEKPDALFLPSDSVAVGFLSETRQLGIKVPEEVAVMGFDHSNLSELFHLTTIDYPTRLQAENVFFKLYNQLNKEQLPLNPLAFTLIEGQTT